MTLFNEYIKSIISIGLITFLCENAISYFSKSSTTAKGVRFLTNLCIFSVIVLPIFSATKNFSLQNFSLQSNREHENKNTFEQLTVSDFEQRIIELILNNTGIKVKFLSANISFDKDGPQLHGITAVVSNTDEEQNVNTYIKETLGENIKTEITVQNNETQ